MSASRCDLRSPKSMMAYLDGHETYKYNYDERGFSINIKLGQFPLCHEAEIKAFDIISDETHSVWDELEEINQEFGRSQPHDWFYICRVGRCGGHAVLYKGKRVNLWEYACPRCQTTYKAKTNALARQIPNVRGPGTETIYVCRQCLQVDSVDMEIVAAKDPPFRVEPTKVYTTDFDWEQIRSELNNPHYDKSTNAKQFNCSVDDLRRQVKVVMAFDDAVDRMAEAFCNAAIYEAFCNKEA